MSVKIEDLKLKEIRRVINVSLNGEEQEVKIFNLTNDKRVDFIEKFKTVGDGNVEGANAIFKEIYMECTDLEIGEEFESVLSNPSVDLMQIQMEIQEIIHELQCEEMISKIGELNQVESMLLAQLTMKKTERVENVLNMIKEFEEEKID